MRLRKLIVLFACTFWIPAVLAQQDFKPFYLGANYGGFKSNGGKFDDNNDFVEGLAGLRFNRFIGIEGDYLRFGNYGGHGATAKVDGWGLAAVGTLPLTDPVSVYGKVGDYFYSAEVHFNDVHYNGSHNDPFFGAGASFRVSDPLSVIVEYDRYKVDVDTSDLPSLDNANTDIDTVKAGIRFWF